MSWFRRKKAPPKPGRHRALSVPGTAARRHGVVLGFRDGSTLSLSADAPGATVAPFTELAGVLLEGLSRTGHTEAGFGR